MLHVIAARLFLIVALLGLSAWAIRPGVVAHASATWYASPAGNDANTCASPSSACRHIQMAITHAAAGDMVVAAAGVYTETLAISTTLSLVGAGAGQTIVDGNRQGSVVAVAVSATVSIAGVTLQHGAATAATGYDGGGLFNSGAVLLQNSSVISNTASAGGGIASSGTLTVTDSTISGNMANGSGGPANGGGLYNDEGGTATVISSTVSNNGTANGGAGVNGNGHPGGSGGDGGGIWSDGIFSMTGSTVSGNTTGSGGPGADGDFFYDGGSGGTGGNGGGLWNSGSMSITASTLTGNTTGDGGSGGNSILFMLQNGGPGGNAGAGGAIWSSGPLSVTASTITSNMTGSGGLGGEGLGGARGGSGGNGGMGGGIWSSSAATVVRSAVSGNATGSGGIGGPGAPASGGNGGDGGGVWSTGALSVAASTVSGNATGSGGSGAIGGGSIGGAGGFGGSGGNGGGIWSGGTIQVTASTLSANAAGSGGVGTTYYHGGPGGSGGGIWSSGVVSLTTSTVISNTAGSGGVASSGNGSNGTGGGMWSTTAALSYDTVASNSDDLVSSVGTLTGTIVANSTTGPNCTGFIAEDQGDNLDSGASCGFTQTTDLTDTDPLLSPLADNGGPTPTMALLPGSPAIDHGGTTATGCPPVDQRGLPRPDEPADGGQCDIGAVEMQEAPVATPTSTPTDPPSATNTPTVTPTTALSPTILVNTAVTSPFRKVLLAGYDFGAHESVAVFWDHAWSTPLAQATTTASGTFSTTLTAPQAVKGTHSLTAVGLSTHRYSTTAITIRPELLVLPSAGTAGSTVVTRGFGFGPNEAVAVYWDKPLAPLGMGTTTGALGSFSGAAAVTGTVPLSATTGLHYVIASGHTSHGMGIGVFAVQK